MISICRELPAAFGLVLETISIAPPLGVFGDHAMCLTESHSSDN